ncbi:MAG: hypothetical protein NVSMB64_28340 [Candidatus Velthaea sp.]
MTSELNRDLEALAIKLRRSTVGVRAGGRGAGSGVVWSSDGTIVTNAHVATTRTVDIEFDDGRTLRGSVERRDDRRDLALVHVDARDLPPAETRDPGDLRAGEILVAFGHPLGVRNVLTTGIAFAGGACGERFVRADLALAPGNSGGPLADAYGRVVGINSMVLGGLALAVPSDDVQRFLGTAAPAPRLGVQLAPARLTDGRSAFVVTGIAPNSAAERSGILLGDVLPARSLARLAAATQLTLLRGGAPIALAIVRDANEASAAA